MALIIMKLINTKKYKGFKTEFFLLSRTEKFLQENGIRLENFISSTTEWYEKILFEYLNIYGDSNWNSEKEYRKNFKVFFCGIINEWSDILPKGFVESFKEEGILLQDTSLIIRSDKKDYLAVREKIFIV